MTARYKVTADQKTWLHFPSADGPAPRMLRGGAEFAYDGWPNAVMEPLNDEARAVCELRDSLRANGVPFPASPAEARSGQKVKAAA